MGNKQNKHTKRASVNGLSSIQFPTETLFKLNNNDIIQFLQHRNAVSSSTVSEQPLQTSSTLAPSSHSSNDSKNVMVLAPGGPTINPSQSQHQDTQKPSASSALSEPTEQKASTTARESSTITPSSDEELNLTLSSVCEIPAVAYDQEKKKFVVMVSIKAPVLEDERVKRAPVDLVLVVDRSGSMSSLMPLVKQTLNFIVDELLERDRVSIVTYDDVADVIFPLTRLDEGGKFKAKQAIQSIHHNGGTNLAEGLMVGLNVIRNRSKDTKNDVASVLLFTDGLANVGVTNTAQIILRMANPGSESSSSNHSIRIPTQQRRSVPSIQQRSIPIRNINRNSAIVPSNVPVVPSNSTYFAPTNQQIYQQIQIPQFPSNYPMPLPTNDANVDLDKLSFQSPPPPSRSIIPIDLYNTSVTVSQTPSSTLAPSNAPSQSSSSVPSNAPIVDKSSLTLVPTNAPTQVSSSSSNDSSSVPSNATILVAPSSSSVPTNAPTQTASSVPTNAPTQTASSVPTNAPTQTASSVPTNAPTQTASSVATDTNNASIPIAPSPPSIPIQKSSTVPPEALEKKIDKAKDTSEIGCVVNCFGFGPSHDSKMLSQIAEAGNGMYFYIENPKVIAQSFADCLGGLLSVVAQQIQIELQPHMTISELNVLTHFRSAYDISTNTTTVFLSDLQSEENRDFLCEVTIPALSTKQLSSIGGMEDSNSTVVMKVLTATLNYVNVITNKQQRATNSAILLRPPQDSEIWKECKPNNEVDKQKNRVLVASAIIDANNLASSHNLSQARETLTSAIHKVQQSISAKDPYCVKLVKDLNDSLSGLRSEQVYVSSGSKQMHGYSNAHSKQRANMQSSDMYSNLKKSNLKSKANW